MTEFFETDPTFESSPKLKQIRKPVDRRWETTEVGRSFKIPLNETNLAALRHKCWAMGKKLNKRFRAVQWESCYEVGRIE